MNMQKYVSPSVDVMRIDSLSCIAQSGSFGDGGEGLKFLNAFPDDNYENLTL